MIALTIPDICKALEGVAKVDYSTYEPWCSKYLTPKFNNGLVTGEAIYQIRCGVVHRGDFTGHKRMPKRLKILFTLPNRGIMARMNIGVERDFRFINLDTKVFCLQMITAARDWYKDHETDAVVHSNLINLIRYRPNGYPGASLAIPVIA
jgi:hypothetical protein